MFLKEKVAIVELALFIPVLFLVLFVTVRRRSIKQLQWIFLPFVCLIHIISAALEAAPSRANEKLVDHAERTVILDNIALCLLLLTHLQFLREMYVGNPALFHFNPYIAVIDIYNRLTGTPEMNPRRRPSSEEESSTFCTCLASAA